jgi:hypothetical protein
MTPIRAIYYNLFVTGQPHSLSRSSNLTFSPIAEIAGWINTAGKVDKNHNLSLVLITPKTIRQENARSV